MKFLQNFPSLAYFQPDFNTIIKLLFIYGQYKLFKHMSLSLPVSGVYLTLVYR